MNEQQLAAVKQALEALEIVRPMENPELAVEEAITALQSIISQDALDKKADNARELGLSYDDAIKGGVGIMLGGKRIDSASIYSDIVSDGGMDPRNQFDKPAPVAWTDLLKQAEEFVRSKSLWKKYIDGTPLANDIAVWMASFAQEHTTPPAPRPVPVKTYHDGKPWPVQPKPWVGLTDEDIEQGHKESWVDKQAFESAVWWAEKKLKEKNT
jgi:hypothetical protein